MDLQKLRTDKGWSQEELAMHAGISVRTVQRIENGQRASLESLKCLAAVFETSVSNLVQEKPMTQSDYTSQHFIEQQEKEAIAYVENLKGFHMSWIAYLIIVPCLYLLNINVTPGFLWVAIVAAVWGFAIVMHAIVMFGVFSVFGGAWEQRKFQERMNRNS